ncbi:LysR family transcriptional regulator [Paenibacillus sp. GP183]|uniref:LysR family transcriptional regulator n=1 Tax=Paenibacillus sp. GP183 TaxID=1882751 RepID=UPI000898F289|nr:LysR family transcriptional regulator [Paenibacillus sp. GP183]SEB72583.1 DNA-binding transcriptional regulator, LysR family [Paenibacillus sp. GP183]
MNWNDLHSFITVAREKSISKASQKLHFTQPTLTTKLKKLEEQLGIHLLERNWEGVKLTDHGTIFLMHALRLTQEMDEIIQMINKLSQLEKDKESPQSNTSMDKLKIGVCRQVSSNILAPLFIELNKKYPLLRFEALSTYNNVILHLLEIGQIHIGITSYFDQRQGFKAIPIFQEKMVLLAPINDPEPIREDLGNVKDLLKKPFILLHPNHSYLPHRETMDRILIELLGTMPEDIQDVHTIITLKLMVSNGMGYAILPTSFLLNSVHPEPLEHSFEGLTYKVLEPENYRMINLGERIPSNTIYLVYADDAPFNFAMADIIHQISSMFSNVELEFPGTAYPH